MYIGGVKKMQKIFLENEAYRFKKCYVYLKKISSFLKQQKMYLGGVAKLHYIRLRYRTSSVRIPPKLLGL
jgi:hypothetical protein